MMLTSTLATILTFLSAVLAVGGVYSIVADLYLRDRSQVRQRLDEEFRKRQREKVRKSSLFKDLTKMISEGAVAAPSRPSLRQRFEGLIEEADIPLSAGQLLGVSTVLGLFEGALTGFFSHNVWAGIVAAFVGAIQPFLYVYHKRKARREKLLEQLPDAFSLMARALQSGKSLQQAMQAVGLEFQPPIAAEFAYCFEQQNLGLGMNVSLRDLGRRNGLLELKIFVMAMLVQHETGGDLADLLEKLGNLIRERFYLRSKIKALTAEGRLQASILLALPPLLFAILFTINRPYAVLLLRWPGLLAGSVVSMLIGALWIRKIINFDI
jgi:tight adherence protein B